MIALLDYSIVSDFDQNAASLPDIMPGIIERLRRTEQSLCKDYRIFMNGTALTEPVYSLVRPEGERISHE